MTDLAWQLANLVYVPYCSSDAHMGDSDHEVVNIIIIIVRPFKRSIIDSVCL